MKNKIKSHRGILKRIKLSGKGKILKEKAKRKQRFSRSGINSSKAKNQDLENQEMHITDERRVRKVINK